MEYHMVVKRDTKKHEEQSYDTNTMCKMRENDHREKDSQTVLRQMPEKKCQQEKCGISETIPSEEETNTGNTGNQELYYKFFRTEKDIVDYIRLNLEQNFIPIYSHMYLLKK